MKKSPRSVTSFDKWIGQRIEAARHAAIMSQAELGDALGVSFQQVQKYEKGVNRVACATLVLIVKALDVDVNYFFDGAPGMGKSADGTAAKMTEFYSVEGAAKLAADFVRLEPATRTAVRQLAASL